MTTVTGTLDNKLLVEQPGPIPLCRSAFSRLFQAVNIQSGEVIHSINCHSWRCPLHKEQWGKKWSAIIGWQLERTPCDLLVNLTTAEQDTTKEEIEAALRHFLRAFRHAYGPTQYIKVVEADRASHRRVHFHLLIINPLLRSIIPAKPENWPNKLSWPNALFEQIRSLWTSALFFAAPLRKASTVVWCQPPKGSGGAAARYAIGYITGSKDKGEDPEHWKGRKLTYSRGFFSLKTAEIWSQVLTSWFGPPEVTRYFWQPKNDLDFTKLPKTDFDTFTRIVKMPIMVQRYKEALFYSRNGYYPTDCSSPSKSPQLVIEPGTSGQLEMDIKLE